MQDVKALVQPALDLEIAIPQPDVRWLRSRPQLTALTQTFAQVLQHIRDRPEIRRLHLFYAGPAAGAVALGRAYSPTMNPALQLYEYTRPVYQPVILLNE